MEATATKMGSVNRPREQKLNRHTLEGQVMLYVAHLMRAKNKTADDLAEATGIHRATIFRWLRGQGSPSLADMAPIAKCLGLKDGWALRPPKGFIESLE